MVLDAAIYQTGRIKSAENEKQGRRHGGVAAGE
jgi:hypothetical protein